ncbi:MAG: antibiotic biosynthesis monooxygenase [Planctomycetales bacterium]
MIHVVALIEVQPGSRDAVVEEFHKLLPEVHAEDGCIEYGPAVDVASGLDRQEPPRDNVVTMIEKWRDVDALKAHLSAPHMNAFRERVKDMVAGLTLHILEPA